jgi:hypothetical protein
VEGVDVKNFEGKTVGEVGQFNISFISSHVLKHKQNSFNEQGLDSLGDGQLNDQVRDSLGDSQLNDNFAHQASTIFDKLIKEIKSLKLTFWVMFGLLIVVMLN